VSIVVLVILCCCFYESSPHPKPLFSHLNNFSDEELIASNVKDKQPKLQFLEKLIIFIEGHLATSIDVKPSKIVSGLEPERTRYLLQLFTVVVTTKSDTIVDERPSKPSTADPAPSKSIKERAESLEGHLISKFDVSEANRNSVPAWVSSVIVISTCLGSLAHTCSYSEPYRSRIDSHVM